ncbi:XrtA/PEP-CTERM system-associated ATPase [Thauera sp. 2A1]|uniref:XrtA/PEP-CTERM system-associated ATPase n=1 Tax=Thauera sp. 2A1 TaxID=2570191 RepID=UPI001292556C|nr:XrtA/PEP-CTERM system-associated ATPase [Thauera sp. 2A1]KAI5916645.1 XrtA-associated ATPase [Thauera sp. 2A1]
MYESFFKLRGKPFQLNPDPAFFYGSRGHRRAMAYLEYGLHQSEGFIVITGEIGAGKTTIVRSLLEHLDPDKVVAANLVSTQVDSKDILRMVAAAFGLPNRTLDKAGLLLALETFLVSITAAGKRALLIVDEAQNLGADAVEELRMLSNFQLEDHALLQSFLVGQPEFRDMMQGAEMQQLRQRVIASYHLGPLDAEETRAYIEHRLSHVGWEGDPIFSPAAFTTVYGHSGGIPRRINTLCDRLMLAAFLAERHSIDEDDVRAVIEELNEEFAARGGKVEARPILRDAVGGAGAGPGVSEIRFDQLALDRLKVSPEVAEQVAGMAANFDVQRIEARLAGLEHSMSATLGVLNQLLQAVRRDGPVEEESQ